MSSVSPRPVSRITGRALVVVSERTRLRSSNPSTWGMVTSLITRSGEALVSSASASSQSAAYVTVHPAAVSARPTTFRSIASSSTTRIEASMRSGSGWASARTLAWRALVAFIQAASRAWLRSRTNGMGLDRQLSRGGSGSDVGAGDEARTRYLNLGKVALYQVSYSRADGSRFYVSTTASTCGAISSTTDRTNPEYSSTSPRDLAASRVDAMTWYSGRSASGTTSTQPSSKNTFTPSVRSTRSRRCLSIIARITRPFTSHGQNTTADSCATSGIRARNEDRLPRVFASISRTRTVLNNASNDTAKSGQQ